jgi:hypothetical protein
VSKASHVETCAVCGIAPLTVWVEETTTGIRPGVRSWVDPSDATHVASCVPAPDPIVDPPVEPPV